MQRSLSTRQLQYLELMGINVWLPRDRDIDRTVEIPAPARDETPLLEWEELEAVVSACTRCGLHQGRTQTVFGTGDTSAEWLIIGEAPGAEEDRQGKPFVGRAGMLLTAMLAAIGLRREQVYIANILKCRPPNNRDPGREEVDACEVYLKRQISLLQPRIILALGRIAAQNLLREDTPVSRMRGRVYHYPDGNIPVIVTYHPAYLLRSPREKRKSWQDLQLAMTLYRENR